jgi:hypothetical protein
MAGLAGSTASVLSPARRVVLASARPKALTAKNVLACFIFGLFDAALCVNPRKDQGKEYARVKSAMKPRLKGLAERVEVEKIRQRPQDLGVYNQNCR